MKATAFLVALSMALLSTTAVADVPGLKNFQGALTDPSGVALDTTVSMTFSIYTDSAGGTQVWTETHSAVTVSNGMFNVLLGSTNTIPDTVFKDPLRWLGIQVGGDPELTPRQRIAAVGYAFRAALADTADYAWSAPPLDDGDWTVSGDDMYSAVSGSVGIGTTSPEAKLDVNERSTPAPSIRLQETRCSPPRAHTTPSWASGPEQTTPEASQLSWDTKPG